LSLHAFSDLIKVLSNDLDKTKQLINELLSDRHIASGVWQSNTIERELEKTIRQHQRAVTAQLDREIRARFGAPKAREERALAADPVVRVARELLGSSSYHAILGSQVPSDH
jgi:hypothetical protein